MACALRVHARAEAMDLRELRPWIAAHAQPPASTIKAASTRLRPLIYIYDLPSIYNTRLLQYRVVKVGALLRVLFHMADMA